MIQPFESLVSSCRIQPTTLVWNSGITNWKPVSELIGANAAGASRPILRLRVTDAEGLRLQPSQIITRNLLRFADGLSAFYLVGD